MPVQKKAWEEWRDIVHQNDPTRPWISADGEDDGDGILPVTVGHYGDINSMKRWIEIGKPWGIGEPIMVRRNRFPNTTENVLTNHRKDVWKDWPTNATI